MIATFLFTAIDQQRVVTPNMKHVCYRLKIIQRNLAYKLTRSSRMWVAISVGGHEVLLRNNKDRTRGANLPNYSSTVVLQRTNIKGCGW